MGKHIHQILYTWEPESSANLPEQILIDQTTSYAQAANLCGAGQQLCQRSDICPDGQLNPPVGGTRTSDTWVPVSDAVNAWVSIGNNSAGSRLCRLHQEITGSQPSWGTSNTAYSFRQIAYCCFATSYSDQPSRNLLTLRR